MQLQYFRPVDKYIRSAFAVNLVRYHDVLAPHAKLRSAVVPKKPDKDELAKTRGKSKSRPLWAALLARTFNLQMEVCSHCGGRMPTRIFASQSCYTGVHFCFAKDELHGRCHCRRCINKKYPDGVGLPSDPPMLMPARPPPQAEFEYYYCDEGA